MSLLLLFGQTERVRVSWVALDLPLAAPVGALPIGQQSCDLPPRAAARAPADTYTVADGSEFWLLRDTVNAGAQSFDLSPRAAARAADYSWSQDLLPTLVGQDAMTAGAQLTELAPRAASRAQSDSYSVADASEFWLFGTDAMVAGRQVFELAPAGPLRLRDYTFTLDSPLELLTTPAAPMGAQAFDLPPRTRPRSASDYSLASGYTLELIGQDARLIGQQSFELAPHAALRATDYSWSQDLIPNLVGQDAVTAGAQLSGNAPSGARRAADYTWLQSFWQGTVGPPQILPIGQAAFDLPTPRARRAVDYSWLQQLIPNLVGRDAMVAGQQLSGNAPAGPQRASTLSETGVDLTLIVSQAPPAIPQGQSTLSSELPPRSAARAREYSVAASFPLVLVGKDALYGAAGQSPTYDWSYQRPTPRYVQGTGEPVQSLLGTLLQVTVAPLNVPSQDMPPRAAVRARDYSIAASFPLVLRGQDAMATGAQLSGNGPPGARRANDYTHTASFPLELIGQDAMTAGDQQLDLPPKAPQRARDYTHLGWFPLELRGQDAMLAGEQQFDLPTPRRARMVDYTHLKGYVAGTFPQESIPTGAQVTILPPSGPRRASKSTYQLGVFEPLTLVTPPRDLVYQLGLIQETWHAGLLLIPKWAIGSPESEFWRVGLPQQ